jgi:topoisomerase IV subunit B
MSTPPTAEWSASIPVEYEEGKGVKELLAFYMGKNTPDRQDYIIENLREDVDKQIEAAVA